MACEIYQPLRHRNVDLAGRVGVDDRVAVAFRHEGLVVEASKITHHLEAFAHLRCAAAEDVRKLVGFDKLRLHGEVMAQIGRHILRFDQGWHHLQHVEMLRHLYQLVKITGRSRAASPLEIRGMGCAGAWLEDEAPRLEKHVPFRHTATAQDRTRRRFQRGIHHFTPDPDHLAGIVDTGATGTKKLPRFGKQDLNPKVFKRCQRGIVNRGDSVIGIEVHLWKRIAESPVVNLARRFATVPRLSSAPPAARRYLCVHAMISPATNSTGVTLADGQWRSIHFHGHFASGGTDTLSPVRLLYATMPPLRGAMPVIAVITT